MILYIDERGIVKSVDSPYGELTGYPIVEENNPFNGWSVARIVS